jgi:hypothetical protein
MELEQVVVAAIVIAVYYVDSILGYVLIHK